MNARACPATDRYGIGTDAINDDQLRVLRTLLGTLLLLRHGADARRGLWQADDVQPDAARKRLRRAGAEDPNTAVRYITLRQSARPAPDDDGHTPRV